MSGTEARRAARAQAQAGTPARPGARPGAASRRALDPDVLAGLEEERDFLLRSLRDLDAEHDAGDLDDHDFAALRDDYRVRAAAVLRAIEEREAGLAAARAAARATPGRRAAVIGAVVLFAVIAGALMASAAGRRGADDTLTGDNRQTCREGLLAAQARLNTAPADAIKLYDVVLDQCPGNAEALTYKGWLLYRASVQIDGPDGARLQELGLQSLADAVTADPGYADARLFRAIAFKDLGRTAEAVAELDLVDAARVPPFMQERVAGMRAELEGGPGTTGTPGTTPTGTRGG